MSLHGRLAASGRGGSAELGAGLRARRMGWGEGAVLQKASTSFDQSIMVRPAAPPRGAACPAAFTAMQTCCAPCSLRAPSRPPAGDLRRVCWRRPAGHRGPGRREGHAAPGAPVQEARRDQRRAGALAAGGAAPRAPRAPACAPRRCGRPVASHTSATTRRSPSSGRALQCAPSCAAARRCTPRS